jgi:hypothetical protein
MSEAISMSFDPEKGRTLKARRDIKVMKNLILLFEIKIYKFL